ncbi:MAG TPA: AAA family ATPase [Candidatus Dormibacteraeota bacterium]
MGRQRELDAIGRALAESLSGRGRIVVLSGEAGIGKTRLLSEVARVAGEVPVLWGRAVEAEGAPPYWPWRQVLDSADEIGDAPAPRSGDASLLSMIVQTGLEGGGAAPGGLAPGDARFRVFDALGRRLREIARARGLVVLLDDLHWADTPSLRLLEHVAQEWDGARALLVVAHRNVVLAREEPLRQTLAQLSRLEGTARIELGGFSCEEVAERLADLTGTRMPDDAVRRLHARTDGNPFFVTEFGHLLQSESADVSREIPQAARDVIARHVSRLSPTCQQVLEVASVAGVRPSPTLVAAALEAPLADVLQRFDEAATAGVLSQAGDRMDYTFMHSLVRDALYSELTAAQRVQWHTRIATELERAARADRAPELSQLAYHWLQAAPGGHAEHAASIATEAADAAMAQLAYEEAARLYAAAAEAHLAPDAAHRARLWLSAARARFLAGELEPALTLCEQAAGAGRAAADVTLIAEAALVLEGVGDPKVSAVIADLCDEALARLPAGALTVRSRLLSQRTTAALYLGGDYTALEPLSRQALDIADETGDSATIVAALRARHTARTDAAGLEERILLAERMLEIAQAERNRVNEFWARLWRFDVALQQGRLDDADAEAGAVATLVERIRLPLASWHLERLRFAVAHSRGDFTAARRAAAAGDRYASSAGQLARFRLQVQEVLLSLLTGGDTASAEAALAQLDGAVGVGRLPTWVVLDRLSRSMLQLSRGNVDVAAELFDTTPLASVSGVMPPAVLVATAHRSIVAAALGRRQDSAILYQLLLPWADLFASAGAGAVACFGSVERVLGLLARALGRIDTAVRHFERAIEREHRAGMRPWAAESGYELALTLHVRARDGDAARALPLVTGCLATAERLGMSPLRARAAALHEALRLGTRQARVLTPREMEIARLVAEGLTSREIADAMHISSRTADNHVQHILDKLDLRSRSQIAAWVAREG